MNTSVAAFDSSVVFKPVLTIAICTFNRGEMLQRVCDALAAQSASIDAFALLIVDNASTDDTSQRIRDIGRLFPNFTTVVEEVPGLSHARNAAWKNCSTPWITYMDDDSRPEPQYVEALLKVIEADNCDIIAGRIMPWRLYSLPCWFLDEYETFNPPMSAGGAVSPKVYACGGNMTIRCAWFAAVGGFSPDFGVRGSVVAFGEETELQMRILAQGGRLRFNPDAVVAHCAMPAKYTIPAQLRISYRSGKSTPVMYGWRSWGDFGRLLLKVPYRLGLAVSGSVRRLAQGSYRWQNAVIRVLGEVCFLAGMFAGWFWLRSHKEWHA